MFSPFIFWPWFAGLIFLVGGLIAARHRIAAASGMNKLAAAGLVFYATPLAVFGAEHLAGAQFLMKAVPAWMPAPLFWTYLVGIALICAAISIVLLRNVMLSGLLLGGMFFSFVLLVHVPRVVADPADRISWAVVLRDLAFGGAAWALAGSERRPPSGLLIAIARFTIAIPVLFFGVEHFLHPKNAPGVPLPKMMPPWIPLGPAWSWIAGAALLVTGVTLLLGRNDRLAALWTGLLVTIFVLVVYSPMRLLHPHFPRGMKRLTISSILCFSPALFS